MTTKYRKKPIVIDAVRFDGCGRSYKEIVDWAKTFGGKFSLSYFGGEMSIGTLEGTMTASAGDWIIRGIKGEFYPCKHDIFEATYEPAEAS